MKYTLLLVIFFIFGCGEKELMEALEANDLVKVEKLLEKGADPNYVKTGYSGPLLRQSKSCESPISTAFFRNTNVLAKVKLLVKYGVKTDYTPCGNGYPVLHYTGRYSDLETMKFLLDQNVNINIRDDRLKNTILHLAVEVYNLEMVKELVERGAFVNAINGLGATPLALAMFKTDIFEYLLKKGAKYNVGTSYPLAFQLANNNRFKEMQLLLDFGWNASFTKDGISAIHYAALSGSLDVVKLLVKNGVPYDLKDSKGRTPFDKAESRKDYKGYDSSGKEVIDGPDRHGRNNQYVVDYLTGLKSQ